MNVIGVSAVISDVNKGLSRSTTSTSNLACLGTSLKMVALVPPNVAPLQMLVDSIFYYF